MSRYNIKIKTPQEQPAAFESDDAFSVQARFKEALRR
jgi:hypothetical protein